MGILGSLVEAERCLGLLLETLKVTSSDEISVSKLLNHVLEWHGCADGSYRHCNGRNRVFEELRSRN